MHIYVGLSQNHRSRRAETRRKANHRHMAVFLNERPNWWPFSFFLAGDTVVIGSNLIFFTQASLHTFQYLYSCFFFFPSFIRRRIDAQTAGMVPHGAREAVKYDSELQATFLGIAEAGDVRLGQIMAHWKAEIEPVPVVSSKFRRSLSSIFGAQKRHC